MPPPTTTTNLRSKAKAQASVSQDTPNPEIPPKVLRTPLSFRGRGRSSVTSVSNIMPTPISATNSAGTIPKSTEPIQRHANPSSSAAHLEDEARRINHLLDGGAAAISAPSAVNSMQDLLGDLNTLQTQQSLMEELLACKRKIKEMTLAMQASDAPLNDIHSLKTSVSKTKDLSHEHGFENSSIRRTRPKPVLSTISSSGNSSEESDHFDPPSRRERRRFDSPPRRETRPPLRCDMEKWKLRFSSGNGAKFWKRMERLQSCYGYDDDQVFRHFHELLDGHALDWYHQIFDEYDITTLTQLKQKFLRTFQPRDSDLKIISRMYNRKQDHDTFEFFYNDIIDMNFTLSKPLPDSQVIEILRTNVSDEIRQRIFTFETKDRIRFFHKANQAYNDVVSSRDKKRSFQDLRSSRKIHEIDLDTLTLGEVEELSSNLTKWQNKRSNRTCFNCHSTEHFLAGCPEDITRIFCFKCGKEGYYSPKCPCRLNQSRGAVTVRSPLPQ